MTPSGVVKLIAALRAHPQHVFPDLNDHSLLLHELSDQSCWESFCRNPDVQPHDRTQCVLLVLFPSQLSAERARHWKALFWERRAGKPEPPNPIW